MPNELRFPALEEVEQFARELAAAAGLTKATCTNKSERDIMVCVETKNGDHVPVVLGKGQSVKAKDCEGVVYIKNGKAAGIKVSGIGGWGKREDVDDVFLEKKWPKCKAEIEKRNQQEPGKWDKPTLNDRHWLDRPDHFDIVK